jgi:hypothetical protein
MKKKWIIILAPIALVAFIALFGEVVMHLWNWLLPALFGWRQITFWQALGLLVLCRILFGGHLGHGYGRSKSRRWGKMTPEEREKFRESMRSRCGAFNTPTTGTNAPA